MKKIREIERLRGVAILMVLVSHLNGTFFRELHPVFTAGWSGVDLFFVISGFVVTLSLLRIFPQRKGSSSILQVIKDRKHGLGIFFKKRMARILPLSLAGAFLPLLLSVVYNQSGTFGSTRKLVKEIFLILTMQYNYERAVGGASQLFYYWSLSVEEHFYLLLPLLFLVCTQREKIFRVVLAGIVLVAFVVRPLFDGGFAEGTVESMLYYVTLSHNRFDMLLCGVLLALLHSSGFRLSQFSTSSKKAVKYFVPFASLLLMMIPGLVSFKVYTMLGFLISTLLSSTLVFLAAQDKGIVFEIIGLRRIMEYIGSRSYGLYIWHMPALWILFETWHRIGKGVYAGYPGWVGFIQYLIVLAALVEGSYQLLERPIIRWGHRLTTKPPRLSLYDALGVPS